MAWASSVGSSAFRQKLTTERGACLGEESLSANQPLALRVGLWPILPAVLEVCQFSRDASVAEAWLIAQEPYLASRDFGHTVDSVEKLIKRHEAFEKSTASWAERFAALEKPTTVS